MAIKKTDRKVPFPLREDGTGYYALDAVPEIDCFIHEAVRYANEERLMATLERREVNWTELYLAEMDRLAAKAGRRVL